MARMNTLGSLEGAKNTIAQAIEKIPAYRKFLEKEGKTGQESFHELPCTSKKTYLLQFPYEELLPDPVSSNAAVFASSGSSGKKPFYWVYKKESLFETLSGLPVEAMFSLDKKKTLVIDALSLGTWVGGDYISFVAKTIALKAQYPMTALTTGTNLDEIVGLIDNFGKYYDQILLVTSPTVFSHVMLTAEHEKISLPFQKMTYIFTEEGFSEDFRIALQKKTQVPETTFLAYSLFASADTDLLGMESPFSVALRKLCFHNHKFADDLGIEPDFPHFFHNANQHVYIESVGDELWITKWQGIPLLRYNLHDRIYLYSWSKAQEFVKQYPFSSPLEKQLAGIIAAAPPNLPDMITVFGRADSAINLGGTKIYEYVFDEIIRSAELSQYLTGLYKAKLAFDGFYSYIEMLVELKENIKPSKETIGKIEDLIEFKLAYINPEFRSDYEKLYKPRIASIGLKAIKVKTVPWPELSSKAETTIKIRGITPSDSESDQQP
ncbi:MAG: hypothetical protein K1X28_05370 [Parachlamydiales bacterium]|nr:hypothetical protein [Parachlamydiales bacterium]